MGLMNELVEVVKAYCDAYSIKCRVLKSQFEMAGRSTYDRDSEIFYYKNRAAGVTLYIDYNVLKGFTNMIDRLWI